MLLLVGFFFLGRKLKDILFYFFEKEGGRSKGTIFERDRERKQDCNYTLSSSLSLTPFSFFFYTAANYTFSLPSSP